jgi:hypothetical protein
MRASRVRFNLDHFRTRLASIKVTSGPGSNVVKSMKKTDKGCIGSPEQQR